MPPQAAYFQAILPGICDQFNEMQMNTPVQLQRPVLQYTIDIQSNVPFYVEILEHPVVLQSTASDESIVHQVAQQNLSIQDTGKTNQDLMKFEQRSEMNEPKLKNLKAQMSVESPRQISDGSVSSWNPNSAIALLGKTELLNNLWLSSLEKVIEGGELKEILPGLLELKTTLYEYTLVIDKILMHNMRSELSCGKKDESLPSVSSVKQTNGKLKMIINKLNPGDLKKIFCNNIVLTEEDILCSFLGLNEGVAKYLKNLPKAFRDHEPDYYYVNSYMQEKGGYLEDSMKGNIKAYAKECGFTDIRAQTFANWFDAYDLKNHQPLSLWLERYVENMFKYALHLNGNMPRYPFAVKPDRDVKVEAERYEEDEEGNPSLVKFNVSVRNCSRTYYNVPQQKPKLWYHGTDHSSAMSIIEEGIQPRKGRAMQDFSDDDGFYVTSDFGKAKKWALVWSRPAVLVFEFDINTENFKVLDLCTSRGAQWKQIVKYNRSGRSRKFAPKNALRQRFDDCDCVLGPCTADGSKGTPEIPGFESWQPSRTDNNDLQLCIRSEEMAEEFSKPSKIKNVLFY